jgi:hypothetical protein
MPYDPLSFEDFERRVRSGRYASAQAAKRARSLARRWSAEEQKAADQVIAEHFSGAPSAGAAGPRQLLTPDERRDLDLLVRLLDSLNAAAQTDPRVRGELVGVAQRVQRVLDAAFSPPPQVPSSLAERTDARPPLLREAAPPEPAAEPAGPSAETREDPNFLATWLQRLENLEATGKTPKDRTDAQNVRLQIEKMKKEGRWPEAG